MLRKIMKEDHNNFKDNHEELAAKKFIALYNKAYGANFELVERSEAPDFRAMDKQTKELLNFEETLATRSPIGPQIWRAMLNGTYSSPGPQTLDLEGELGAYRDNIKKKFSKHYGSNCALVVFQFGPVMPWEVALNYFKSMFDFSESPFDKGIYMISWEELYRLDK